MKIAIFSCLFVSKYFESDLANHYLNKRWPSMMMHIYVSLCLHLIWNGFNTKFRGLPTKCKMNVTERIFRRYISKIRISSHTQMKCWTIVSGCKKICIFSNKCTDRIKTNLTETRLNLYNNYLLLCCTKCKLLDVHSLHYLQDSIICWQQVTWASYRIRKIAGCVCATSGLVVPTCITARAWRTYCDTCRYR